MSTVFNDDKEREFIRSILMGPNGANVPVVNFIDKRDLRYNLRKAIIRIIEVLLPIVYLLIDKLLST